MICRICEELLSNLNWFQRFQLKHDNLCKKCSREKNRASYKKNYLKRRAANLKYVHKNKAIVFQHYGNQCACCGQSYVDYLQLDHKEGGGSTHRRSLPNTQSIYRWAILNEFPASLQLLCANCHFAKTKNKACHHFMVRRAV